MLLADGKTLTRSQLDARLEVGRTSQRSPGPVVRGGKAPKGDRDQRITLYLTGAVRENNALGDLKCEVEGPSQRA